MDNKSDRRTRLDQLSPSDRIDAICDEFEQKWIAGGRPALEKWLKLVPSEQHPALVRELLNVELDHRRGLGEAPQRDEYESRLVRFSSILQELFRDSKLGSGQKRARQNVQESLEKAETRSRSPESSVAALGETGDWEQSDNSDQESTRVSHTPESNDTPAAFSNGRYQVRRFLGDGGQKTALLAHDVDLGRDVVVAVLKSGTLDDASLSRLRLEARAMAQLDDHPHIVSIYDIGEQGGQPYLVTQFIEGGSVEDLLADRGGGALATSEAVRIAEQICQALEHAHRAGVVHRDIKPANVWLTDAGEAKLGDFGLAASLDRSRLAGTGDAVGTAAYMPPEQALGTDVGPQSDLYSLGVMLYEMVSGCRPFQGDSFMSIVSQHINAEPVPPRSYNPNVSPSLNKLILQLLAKVLEDRPRSAAVVREVLVNVSDDSTDKEAPVEPLESTDLASRSFVGRSEEMLELTVGLDEAIVGQGQIFFISGDPGSGKTRLAEELRTAARLRNMNVFGAKCFEGEGAPAFWPWVQIIRALSKEYTAEQLLHLMGSGAADIVQLDPDIRQLLPDLPAPSKLDPEHARFRLFDGITRFVRAAVAERPLLLILDDIQWADESSLKLLEFMASHTRDASLVVLGTHRNLEADIRHPLLRMLGTLSRQPNCHRIPLCGLPQRPVGELIAAMSGLKPTTSFVTSLWKKTDGNPFFVCEIIRLLIEQGQLEDANRDIHGVAIGIPESVREVVGRRLEYLSGDCTRALTVASAIGREFLLDVLESVGDSSPDELLDSLDEAVAARLLDEIPGGGMRYAFTHDLIRETLYAELGTARKNRLHAKIGFAIERNFADDLAPYLPELAQHFFRAARFGNAAKAIQYCSQAGLQSLQSLAYEEAVRFGEMALRTSEESRTTDEQLKCRLELELAKAFGQAGRVGSAAKFFGRAAERARRIQSPEQLARAALGFEKSTWLDGSLGVQAVRYIEDAIAEVETGESPRMAELLSALGRAERWSGRLDIAMARGTEAVEMARRLADPELLSDSLSRYIDAMWGPDTAHKRLNLANEQLGAAEQLGDSEKILHACMWRLVTALELGNTAEASAAIQLHANVSKKSELPFYLMLTDGLMAMQALLEGQFEDAQRLTVKVRDSGERLSQHADGVHGIHMFTLFREQGRLAEVALAFKRFTDDSETATWQPALAVMFAELGFGDKAAEVFGELAADEFASIPQDGKWSISMSFLADVCYSLQDDRTAGVLHRILQPWDGRNVVGSAAVVCYGSMSRHLGQLATLLGKWDLADKYFQRALEMNGRLGARPYVAHTQHEYADMLFRRNGTDDRRKGAELLQESQATASDLGMQSLTEKVAAAINGCQG